jgi:hypothetical protein
MVRFCGRALPRRLRVARLFFFSLFLLLVASPFAFADDATAKLHFQNGIHLYDQQPPDYEGALAEFRAAEKDKPSPGIKRNIALCLRALHRYGEAMDELEEMLATGGDQLKPQTREAGQKMIEELSTLIATVRVKIILHKSADAKAAPVPRVDLTVDDEAIPPEKMGGSLRVGPGEHLLVARATGYGDASKKVSVVSGDKDVPVQLDLLPVSTPAELGFLRVHASNDRAAIFIDGVALANGTWEGGLPSGKHHIEARADGSAPFVEDVDVAPGAHVVLEANVGAGTGAITTPPPPPYENPKPKKEKAPERYWYLQGGVGAFFGTQKIDATGVSNQPWNEAIPGDHGFGGLSLVAKFGRKLTRVLSLELWAEVGGMKPNAYKIYNANGSSSIDADVTETYGQLGPEIKIHSVGKFQLFAGTGLGLEVDSVALNNLASNAGGFGTNNGPTKGAGVEGAWLLEGGAQLYVADRFFFQASIFLDVSGNGNINDSSSGARYFLDGPWSRGGLRLQFGFDL